MKQIFQIVRDYLWQPHRRPLTILGGSVCIVMLLVITKPHSKPAESLEKTYNVEAKIVYPMPLPSSLYLYGIVETPEKSTLVSTVASQVQTTPFKEGARVKAGDILLTLDTLEPELVYRERAADVNDIEAQMLAEENRYQNDIIALEHEKALLALYTRGLEREQQLAQKKMGSEANVDKAQQSVEAQSLAVNTRSLSVADHPARLAQLQARLDKASAYEMQAKMDLSRAQIVSPYSARIAKLHVAPMDRVQVGTPLIDIFKSDALEVRVQIPTRYLAAFEQSRAHKLPIKTTGKIDGKTFPLVFERLSSEADPGHGGVDAFFSVDQNAKNVSLGRPVDITLKLPNLIPVIAIPITALYSHDRVFKIEKNRLVNVTVAVFGERLYKGKRELLITSADLKAGDQVLTSLLPNAMTGTRVHVITKE